MEGREAAMPEYDCGVKQADFSGRAGRNEGPVTLKKERKDELAG